MKTSWYILSTIVILAVLVDGTHGLPCYNCTNIADLTSCKQVVNCNTDEFCYTQITGYVGGQTRFTQGCRQKQICRYPVLATQPSPNIVGRFVASPQVTCNECCGIDKCNSHLCKNTQAISPVKCVDDPEFDCQQVDALLDLCSDVTHAKLKCRKYCGLCTILDGSWSSWHSWSSCDRTCGNGTQTRTRSCDNPAPQDGGLSCPGVNLETSVCVLGKCPVHGGWATWSAWGSCSATCGMGLQRRDRSCSHPYPGPDGNPCFGDYRDDRACFDGACADGIWSSWSSWGSCTASCLGGLSNRMRTCNNPSPSTFGHDCIGNSEETKICNTHYCQDVHNGGWSSWSSWSSSSCGSMTPGTQQETRTRSCTNPSPSPFGHTCAGTDWQSRPCRIIVRLMNGTSSSNGRVEVFISGRWGTVCDDAFSQASAKVVCRMLHKSTASVTAYADAHYGKGIGPILLDDVACSGFEQSLLDCSHRPIGVENCSHGEDAGVSCG